MATFNYARSINTADRLIKKFGQLGAIRRTIAGGGPSRNPGPATFEFYRVSLAVLEYDVREVDGTNILSTDKQVYVSVKGFSLVIEPSKDAVVLGGTWVAAQYQGGQVMTIIPPVKQLNPAGINVFWELQARI
jgi:hypothetical protein